LIVEEAAKAFGTYTAVVSNADGTLGEFRHTIINVDEVQLLVLGNTGGVRLATH